jgi:hypothetical protein
MPFFCLLPSSSPGGDISVCCLPTRKLHIIGLRRIRPMAHLPRKRKWLHCKTFYHPDHRNVTRQRYCSKPECRKVSKTESQRRWLQKPDNLDHFKGSEHVERVRQWRLEHPGYWRRKPPEVHETSDALQETLTPQGHENQSLEVFLPTGQNDALQDSFFMQPAVLIGLISHLTGLALQEDSAATLRRLQQLGGDILGHSLHSQGGLQEAQTTPVVGPTPKGAPAVQLGRSAPGPGALH